MIEHDHLVIIGAQRSGSTWLYDLLDNHPSIYMSRPKRPEPKYFLDEASSRINYLKEVFSEAPSNVRYWGEKSTSYYEHPEVAERIDRCLPNVKLVVILRNPVDRALSNYKFSWENGLEKRTLEEVFIGRVPPPSLNKSVSVSPFAYLQRGHYARHLTPFLRIFGSRLFVMTLEESINSPLHGGIWDFLQLNPSSVDFKAVNASSPIEVPDEIKDSLHVYYEPHIVELEKLLGRSFNIWRT